MRVAALLFLSLISHQVFAQEAVPDEPVKLPWAHESELSFVSLDGNNQGSTLSTKQKTDYHVGNNLYSLAGRYLESNSNGTETARAWDFTLRYEYTVSDTVSGFLAYGSESDPFNGFVQRDHTDIGRKDFFLKGDKANFFIETGYRYQKEITPYQVAHPDQHVTYTSLGRFYTEYNKVRDATLSYKLWLELLSDTHYGINFANTEPSFSLTLSHYLSLRMAYLVRYHYATVLPKEVQVDSTFTTSLVARF